MDAEYLQSNVGPILSEGLAEVMMSRPEDPVDELANWLFKYVERHERREQQAQEKKALEEADLKLEKEEQKCLQAQQLEKQQQRAEKETIEKFISQLGATQADCNLQRVLADVCDFLQETTHATGVYIAQVDAQHDLVRFTSTTPDHAFMLEETLSRPESIVGSLFDGFNDEDEEEEEEEEEDEEDEEKKAARLAAKEAALRAPKSVWIPNVFVGPESQKLQFIRAPKLGSFHAVRIKCPGTLNSATIHEAVEKKLSPPEEPEEEEEEEEDADSDDEEAKERKLKKAEEKAKRAEEEKQRQDALSPEEKRVIETEKLLKGLKLGSIQYTVCLDTLGQDRQLTDDERAIVARVGDALRNVVEKADRYKFLAEVNRHIELKEAAKLAKPEEEAEEALNKLKEEFGEEAPEEKAQFKYIQSVVVGLRDHIVSLQNFNVFPWPKELVQATLYLLGYKQDAVADKHNHALWSKMRGLLDDDLVMKLESFDPEDEATPEKRGKINLPALLEELPESEDMAETNYPLSQLQSFITHALAYEHWAIEDRERKAEEERARLEAEREAKEEEERLRKEKEEEEKEAAEDEDEDAED